MYTYFLYFIFKVLFSILCIITVFALLRLVDTTILFFYQNLEFPHDHHQVIR